MSALREKLKAKRDGATYEVRIKSPEGYRKVFVRLGTYSDGRVGEIFVDVAKDGSELRTSLNTWAIMVSLALQHGLPVSKVRDTFRGVRCNPGVMDCPGVEGIHGESCSSIWDMVSRLLEAEVDQDGKLISGGEECCGSCDDVAVPQREEVAIGFAAVPEQKAVAVGHGYDPCCRYVHPQVGWRCGLFKEHSGPHAPQVVKKAAPKAICCREGCDEEVFADGLYCNACASS